MELTENLIDLDYTNDTCIKNQSTIWEIENNEKTQFIEYIDNIISAKFETKIADQDKTIKQLTEENKKNNDIINNLLFDIANNNVFNIRSFSALEKYNRRIIDANRPIELEYIDYSSVSEELNKYYKNAPTQLTCLQRTIIDKNVTNMNIVKKICLTLNDISTLNFRDKIFKAVGPNMFSWYFQLFLKKINMRREYFQIDNINNNNKETSSRLILWITDNQTEKEMIEQFPNITIKLIPEFKGIFNRF